jgi:hypothetical protein
MKFPKTLCVKIEKDRSGPDYFVADADISAMAEMYAKTTVAIYQFKETKIVQGVAHISKARKTK